MALSVTSGALLERTNGTRIRIKTRSPRNTTHLSRVANPKDTSCSNMLPRLCSATTAMQNAAVASSRTHSSHPIFPCTGAIGRLTVYDLSGPSVHSKSLSTNGNSNEQIEGVF